MKDETNPPEPTPSTLPPLVDWMSRHGWIILAALFALQLVFHAYAVGAQTSSTSEVPALRRVQFDVAPVPE